jgi:hypothetical protein
LRSAIIGYLRLISKPEDYIARVAFAYPDDEQVKWKAYNVQPTIKIAPGYRFNVRVNRDLAFESGLPGASTHQQIAQRRTDGR